MTTNSSKSINLTKQSTFPLSEKKPTGSNPNLAEFKKLFGELADQYLGDRREGAGEVYLTEKEVADRLNLSVRTIQAWRQSRLVDLPYCKFGNSVRYPLSKVLKFEAQCRQSQL